MPGSGGGASVIPLRDSPLASRPSLAPPPAAHHPLPLRLPTPMFNSAALVGAPLSVRCEMTSVPVYGSAAKINVL
eukprot:scaffold17682_cov113-Isochrysis_galbana.AAC.8